MLELLLILIIIGPFVLIPLGIMPEGREAKGESYFRATGRAATQSAVAQSNRCPTEMIKYCRFRRRTDCCIRITLSCSLSRFSDFDFCVSVIREIFNVQCWVGSNQGYLAWKDHGPRMWGQTACMVDFRLVPNPYQLEWDSLANKPLIRLARPIRLLLLAVTARTLCI